MANSDRSGRSPALQRAGETATWYNPSLDDPIYPYITLYDLIYPYVTLYRALLGAFEGGVGKEKEHETCEGIQGVQCSRRNKGNIGTALSGVFRDYHGVSLRNPPSCASSPNLNELRSLASAEVLG